MEPAIGRCRAAQAHRYADEQKVHCIAVSDGIMLYARDHLPGGRRDRVFVHLDQAEPPVDLWWLSTDGIYRLREDPSGTRLNLLPPAPDGALQRSNAVQPGLLHLKYRLPSVCFGYVGNVGDRTTWHLPYLRADGSPDLARLPKSHSGDPV